MAHARTRGIAIATARGAAILWRGRRTRYPGVAAGRSQSRLAAHKPKGSLRERHATQYRRGDPQCHSRATSPRLSCLSLPCPAQAYAQSNGETCTSGQWLKSGPPRHRLQRKPRNLPYGERNASDAARACARALPETAKKCLAGSACCANYWRRGRDSNPRYGCPYAAFRVRCIQPLCHLSADRGLSGIRRI